MLLVLIRKNKNKFNIQLEKLTKNAPPHKSQKFCETHGEAIKVKSRSYRHIMELAFSLNTRLFEKTHDIDKTLEQPTSEKT